MGKNEWNILRFVTPAVISIITVLYLYDDWRKTGFRHVDDNVFPWGEFIFIMGVITVFIFTASLLIFWFLDKIYEEISEDVKGSISSSLSKFKKIRSDIEKYEMDAYNKVADEVENNIINKALWLKAFEDSGGDKNKQRAQYIKYRVKQIKKNREK